jgi:protein-S-isoprenylcysteine O-methyltransferase Ste14
MSTPQARIKSGKASLVGGIVVAVAAFALWVACTHELGADTPVWLAVGAVVAVGVGVWIRVADL